MTRTLFILLIVFSFKLNAQNIFVGIVYDMDSFPIPFANIILFQNDTISIGTSSDFDGVFYFENIKNGDYYLKINLLGETKNIGNLHFYNDKILKVYYLSFKAEMHSMKDYFPQPDLFIYNPIIIDIMEIKNQNRYNLNKLISSNSHLNTLKDNNLTYNGKVKNIKYNLDGINLFSEPKIPTSSIYKIKIHTNGVPARLGNSTGAIIEITSKSYFDYFN